MKYKVGDKVRVRKDLIEDKSYYMDDRSDNRIVVLPMLDLKGRIVTITRATECGYSIKEFGCTWTDEMFEDTVCDKKIVITSDGVETLARLYENGKVVKKATAKCSPEDEFDFNVGAKLAFERLTEPAAEKKEEYYNGKVVCVKVNTNPGIYTAGKIYQFVDGRFIDDTGNQMPQSRQMKDFMEWQKYSASEFIEIKE